MTNGNPFRGKSVGNGETALIYLAIKWTVTVIRAMTFEYIKVFYNRKRLHSTLGYRSPCQMLSDWHLDQRQEKQVADRRPLEGEKPKEPHCTGGAGSRRNALA